MRPDDFFTQRFTAANPAALETWGTVPEFDHELADRLRQRPLADVDDLYAAMALSQLVHDDLERYGTDGGQRLSDEDLGVALRTLRVVLKRLGITFDVPFRSFGTFRTYWINHGMSNSWQARRDYLGSVFDPVHHRLTRLEEERFEAQLADPVSPRGRTGWGKVDNEIRELRRRFSTASTPQDYRAVGSHCVGVLEALSRTVYDPAKHLRPGEQEPPADKTKQRLGRYVEDAIAGRDHAELRGLITKAVEFAQLVKHRETPTRRHAGIAADAVIMLANILRRLAEPEQPQLAEQPNA
jgi:hypothetical protein